MTAAARLAPARTGDGPLAGALLIAAPIYARAPYAGLHPLRIPRVSTVLDLSRALGWLPPESYRPSPRAKPAALTAFHTPAYVQALQRAQAEGAVSAETRARHHLGTLSNPVFAQMYDRPATGVGGVLLAAELLARASAGAIHVPGGGTHHGLPDRANGFCYLNDPVLGILALKRAGLTRIAYVDIDAHHCDGVEAAFTGDPALRLISVHEQARWPFTGALTDSAGGSAFNLPVPSGLNDSEMTLIREDFILPRLQEFRPEIIILQAGADALREDPLARLALSNLAYRATLAAIRPLAPRLLLLGGGGYNPWSVGRCWTLLWAELSGQEVPDRLPPEAEAVLRGLSWNGGARPPPEETLFTTLADAPRPGPIRADLRDRLATLARR